MEIDGKKVAECLYAEFGRHGFLTREIPAVTMNRLVRLTGVGSAGKIGRNSQIGRAVGSLDQAEFTLDSGQRVKLIVERPENQRLPRRFRLVELPTVNDKVSRVNRDEGSVDSGSTRTTYAVVLVQSEHGYSASCPALPGCHSQGAERTEALENIREAIAGWLEREARVSEDRSRTMVDDYTAAGYAATLVNLEVS